MKRKEEHCNRPGMDKRHHSALWNNIDIRLVTQCQNNLWSKLLSFNWNISALEKVNLKYFLYFFANSDNMYHYFYVPLFSKVVLYQLWHCQSLLTVVVESRVEKLLITYLNNFMLAFNQVAF